MNILVVMVCLVMGSTGNPYPGNPAQHSTDGDTVPATDDHQHETSAPTPHPGLLHQHQHHHIYYYQHQHHHIYCYQHQHHHIYYYQLQQHHHLNSTIIVVFFNNIITFIISNIVINIVINSISSISFIEHLYIALSCPIK